MTGEIIKAIIKGAGEGLAQGIGIALIAMFILLAIIFLIILALDIIIILKAHKIVKSKRVWFVSGVFLASLIFAFLFKSVTWYLLSPIFTYAVYRLLKKKSYKPKA